MWGWTAFQNKKVYGFDTPGYIEHMYFWHEKFDQNESVVLKCSLCLYLNCTGVQIVMHVSCENQQEVCQRKCSIFKCFQLTHVVLVTLQIFIKKRHLNQGFVQYLMSVHAMIIWLFVTIQTYFFFLFCFGTNGGIACLCCIFTEEVRI